MKQISEFMAQLDAMDSVALIALVNWIYIHLLLWIESIALH